MIWNPVKRFKLKRDWKLVETIVGSYTWSDRNNRQDEVVYYLLENGLGHRKCHHSGTGICAGNDTISKRYRTTHPLYLKRVKPWLLGGFDPKIPSYETIEAKEFKDSLAGKKT